MAYENPREALESQGHSSADLKQLGQHQQSLRLFMENWLTQHDAILQAIAESVHTQHESTAQVLQLEEPLAFKPQIIHQEGLPQVVPSNGVRMCHQRNATDSDMLRSVRGATTNIVEHVAQACKGRFRSKFETKFSNVSTSLRHFRAASSSMVNQRLAKLVSSPWFECLCSAIIIINAVVIASTADYAASHLDNPTHTFLEGVEMIFATFYVMEWTLRLVAYRLHFFFVPECLWNLFDTVLVVSAAHDLFIYFSVSGKGRKASILFLRIVRVMKMLKLLRTIRIMRMFRELRLVASLMRASLKPLLWAVMLISIISYIVGICFLQAGTSYLQERLASQEEAVAIQVYWGSVWRSMLSLYMATTNGDSWKEMANALIPVGYTYYLLFLLYVAFFTFIVMNTLTSLFLDAVIRKADKDTSSLIREELKKTGAYVTKAAALFRQIDQNSSGNITEQDFLKYANDAKMAALASSLELDVSDMEQFYNMLSCRGKYAVDVDTFAVGCLKLKGPARSIDLQELIASQKRAARTLEDLVAKSQSAAVLFQQFLSIHQDTTRSTETAIQCEVVGSCVDPSKVTLDPTNLCSSL